MSVAARNLRDVCLISVSPSTGAFAAGFFLYPLTFYLSLSATPTPLTITTVREILSAFHCTLVTILSITCLNSHSAFRLLSSQNPPTPPIPESISNASLPLITTRSPFANAITAYETSYLLQDTLCIFYYSRHVRTHVRSPELSKAQARGLNVQHLLLHHIPLLIAFGVLQVYIYFGWESGVLVIVMLMLMNASSPIGTIRWLLMRYEPHWKSAIMVTEILYLGLYAICRVGLIWAVLEVFGRQRDWNTWRVWHSLRWECRIGTGAMAVVNSLWLAWSIRKFFGKYWVKSDLQTAKKTKIG